MKLAVMAMLDVTLVMVRGFEVVAANPSAPVQFTNRWLVSGMAVTAVQDPPCGTVCVAAPVIVPDSAPSPVAKVTCHVLIETVKSRETSAAAL